MRRHARELGQEIDRSVSKALPDGMAEGGRRARREGARAGDDYSGSFANALRKNITRAFKALPELEIKEDSSDADKAIARIRSELKELRDQHVNLDIDDATALTALRRIDHELSNINRTAATVSVHANTTAARRELAAIERLADDAFRSRRTERFADDAFSSELRRAAKSAASKLPEISLRFDENGLGEEIAEIRAQLKTIADDEAVGIDIDDDEAVRKLDELHGRLLVLHQLSRDDLRLEADTDAALNDIETFFRRTQARRLAAEKEARDEAARQQKIADRLIEQQRRQFERDRDAAFREQERRVRDAQRTADQLQRQFDRDRAEAYREQDRREKEADRRRAQESEANMGGFARRFRDDLERAFRSIRQTPVDLNITPAQTKLNALRARIAALRDAEIGVDLDVADAITEARALKTELERLSRETPDIQVRADIVGAFAALTAIDRLAEHLDGRRVDLRVDLDDAARGITNLGNATTVPLSRLGALIAVIAGIGPALVPIGAVATVALGSIATAAAGAIVGIGAVALAFVGIGDAVKALNTYQNDAKKSAKSLGQSENQVASAVAGVTSAERALQAARENAAFSARRSAQAVVQARRSVTDAEKDAARAQRDLARAIKEVQQQEEDRQLQLRDNALAQRQATIDLADAKKDLDKVLSNPKATLRERELAKIAYEERVLQLDRLTVSQKRLQAEQDEANRKGVKGSDQVVAAQERIAASQQAVTDAQQNLANTIEDQRRQQQESSRAILGAQESLVQSQRTLTQAYLASGVAGGEALQTLQEKMDALSPAGRRFARFIFSLKDEFLQLRDAAQEGFLPGAQEAILGLLPYLPRLRGFLSEVATVMGDIAVRVVDSFSNSGWQTFFTFIGATAVPSLKGMATVTGNIVQGTRDLLIALSAFNKPIGRGLIDMSESFAKWAFQLSSSAGYRKFLEYVRDVGPEVVDFFISLGKALWNIIVAAAPVGRAVLIVVTGFLKFVAAIPTNYLTVLILGISALAIGVLFLAGTMKAIAFATTLATATKVNFARATTVAQAALARFQLTQLSSLFSMATYTNGIRNLVTNFSTLGGAAAATGRGMAAFSAFLGGPWGIALLAAGVALSYLYYKHQQQEAQTKANVEAFRRLGAEIKRTGSIQSDSARDTIAQSDTLKRLVLDLDRMGRSTGDFYNGLAIASTRMGDFVGSAQSASKAARAYGLDVDLLAKALTGNKQAQDDLLAALALTAAFNPDKKLREEAAARRAELEQLFAQQELNVAVEKELAEAHKRTGSAFDDANPGLKAYVESLKTLADVTSTAADKADALRAADDALFGSQRNLQESMEAQARALRERNELLNDEEFLQKAGVRTLDIKTEAGARLTDVLEAELEAINATFRANIAAGTSVADATREHEREIESLRKKAKDKGLDQKATEHLIAVYGQVPTSRVTDFATTNFGTTKAQLDELMAYQLALREGISLAQAQAKLNPTVRPGAGRGNSQNAALATGGPVIGPGDKTSDSVQAWIPKTGTPIALSDGEWVHRAAAVDYYGSGFMRAINERRIPREMFGMLGFAGGGLLQQVAKEKYPFPYNTASTRVPSRAEAARNAYPAFSNYGPTGAGPGFLPWPSSPRAQRGDTGVWRSILALVRSSGIPFNFGNAYRDGDPLWHGSGRAIDLMGYNQDALANFFLQRQNQLLELIHLTPKGGYFVTRGKRKQNFAVQGPLHRNHLHVAMKAGGLVQSPPQLAAATATYDSGGELGPGYTLAYNGTGQTEHVLTSRQMAELQVLAKQQAAGGHAYHFQFRDTTLDASKLRAIQNREAALARVGRAR